MIKPVYSIRDQKTDVFESPIVQINDDVAIRFFAQCLQQVPVMQANPEDFTLHKIGSFDETSGKIVCSENVQFIISGLSCIQVTNQQRQEAAHETHKNSQVGDESPVQPSS